MPKTFYNLEEASLLLGHGRNYFRRNPDLATQAGAFTINGDFKSRLMFVRTKVDAMTGTLPAKRPAPFKVKRITLPIYQQPTRIPGQRLQ